MVSNIVHFLAKNIYMKQIEVFRGSGIGIYKLLSVLGKKSSIEESSSTSTSLRSSSSSSCRVNY